MPSPQPGCVNSNCMRHLVQKCKRSRVFALYVRAVSEWLACRFQSLIIASACACASVYAGVRACGTHQLGFLWLESTKQSGPACSS